MKEKKQSALSRLMGIAGGHKYFTYASCVLAILSAWIALIPFYDVWRIMKEILEVRPDQNLWLAGGWICSVCNGCLYCRTDVLPYCGLSCTGKYENRYDGAYHEAAAWLR